MSTADVVSNEDSAQTRYTSHLFDPSLERFAEPSSGSAVRLPSDLSLWPPGALFDAVYASAVLEKFGVKVEDILEKWEDLFYPGGAVNAAHADDKHRRDRANAGKENNNMQEGGQQGHYDKRVRLERGVHDAIRHDMVTMIRYLAMELESGGIPERV